VYFRLVWADFSKNYLGIEGGGKRYLDFGSSEISKNVGFLRFFRRGDVGFWGVNQVWWVSLQGLGKIGKKKMVKNW